MGLQFMRLYCGSCVVVPISAKALDGCSFNFFTDLDTYLKAYTCKLVVRVVVMAMMIAFQGKCTRSAGISTSRYVNTTATTTPPRMRLPQLM